MELIVNRIVGFLLRNDAIDPDDRDVYEYGLYVLLADILDIGATLIIALLLRILPQTILYHAVFIPLRRSAGGFHASTRIRCFVLSLATWLLAMWLVELTAGVQAISIACSTLTLAAVWRFAPVEHENNPLSGDEMIRLRRKSRIIASAFTGIVITTALFPTVPLWVSSSIGYGMLFFACSLSYAYFAARKK